MKKTITNTIAASCIAALVSSSAMAQGITTTQWIDVTSDPNEFTVVEPDFCNDGNPNNDAQFQCPCNDLGVTSDGFACYVPEPVEQVQYDTVPEDVAVQEYVPTEEDTIVNYVADTNVAPQPEPVYETVVTPQPQPQPVTTYQTVQQPTVVNTPPAPTPPAPPAVTPAPPQTAPVVATTGLGGSAGTFAAIAGAAVIVGGLCIAFCGGGSGTATTTTR